MFRSLHKFATSSHKTDSHLDGITWKRYNRTTEMNFTNRQDLNKLNLHPKKKSFFKSLFVNNLFS